MNIRDVDPKIKALFPWALFLVLAALFAFGAIKVHAEEDIWACYASQRYQAMSSAWPPCNGPCGRVKAYVQSHPEGKAPRWVKRARQCK